jgi:hypothetical protein
LQKVAPRNFDAFFQREKRQSKIPAVPPQGRRLCNSRLQQGDFSFACRNQAAEAREGIIMTNDHTKKIAELNDLCRKAMGIAGRAFITQGIRALPEVDQSTIVEKVETYVRQLQRGQ